MVELGDSVDEARRFGGLSRLYGERGASQIRAAHGVVVGLGGVGSWAAEALARSGVGRLTLIDLDHIAESNINRQVHALSSTVGQAKVLAMKGRIALINPNCAVAAVEEFVDADNWPQLAAALMLDTQHIGVIDACDQISAKAALAAWAIEQRRSKGGKLHFISVGAAGGKRFAHQVDIADLSQVSHDPLLARLRSRLRQNHSASRTKAIGVNCVFSREPVLQPDRDSGASDGSLNCHGYGSVVGVTATFGLCAATWLMGEIAASSDLAASRGAK